MARHSVTTLWPARACRNGSSASTRGRPSDQRSPRSRIRSVGWRTASRAGMPSMPRAEALHPVSPSQVPISTPSGRDSINASSSAAWNRLRRAMRAISDIRSWSSASSRAWWERRSWTIGRSRSRTEGRASTAALPVPLARGPAASGANPPSSSRSMAAWRVSSRVRNFFIRNSGLDRSGTPARIGQGIRPRRREGAWAKAHYLDRCPGKGKGFHRPARTGTGRAPHRSTIVSRPPDLAFLFNAARPVRRGPAPPQPATPVAPPIPSTMSGWHGF